MPRPGRFTAEKDPVPIVYEAGWASEPVWTGAEHIAPTGIRSPDRPVRSESLSRPVLLSSTKSIFFSFMSYFDVYLTTLVIAEFYVASVIELLWSSYGALHWNTGRKSCPSANSSTTNPIRIGLGSKPGLRRESPATDVTSCWTSRTSMISLRNVTKLWLANRPHIQNFLGRGMSETTILAFLSLFRYVLR